MKAIDEKAFPMNTRAELIATCAPVRESTTWAVLVGGQVGGAEL